MPLISDERLQIVESGQLAVVIGAYTVSGDPHYDRFEGVWWGVTIDLYGKTDGGQFHAIPGGRVSTGSDWIRQKSVFTKRYEKTFPTALIREGSGVVAASGNTIFLTLMKMKPIVQQPVQGRGSNQVRLARDNLKLA